MAKLTLKAAKQAIGIGTFVEKEVSFRDKDGVEFRGEILIKIASHDDIANAPDVWQLKKKEDLTLDQLRKSLVFQVVYEDQKKKFFSEIGDTGTVSTELIDAMYTAADEVLDFSGKNWISKKKTSSSVSSSLTELEEEQLPKPEEI